MHLEDYPAQVDQKEEQREALVRERERLVRDVELLEAFLKSSPVGVNPDDLGQVRKVSRKQFLVRHHSRLSQGAGVVFTA